MSWEIRPCQMNEISALMERSLATAQAQLMERETRSAGLVQVASQVQRMFTQTLATRGGTCLVATSGPRIGGYVLLMPAPNAFTGATEGVVMDVWVDPELRGQGLAGQLLAATDEWGHSIGARGMVAQVAVQNGPSLRALQKAGYRVERYVVGKG